MDNKYIDIIAITRNLLLKNYPPLFFKTADITRGCNVGSRAFKIKRYIEYLRLYRHLAISAYNLVQRTRDEMDQMKNPF